MPIYEYACRKCSHTLDVLQKMSDEPLVECPSCGEAALRRLISAPRFRLKGDGWYETDFKKDKQRNVLKKDDEAPAKDKGEGKKEGASDKTEKPTAKGADQKKTSPKPAATAD